MEMQVPGRYVILPSDAQAYWGLLDLESGRPIAFGWSPNDIRNQWIFTEVPDAITSVVDQTRGLERDNTASMPITLVNIFASASRPNSSSASTNAAVKTNHKPEPTVSAVATTILLLVAKLNSSNVEVVRNACMGLERICYRNKQAIVAAVTSNAVPPLVHLLSHDDIQVQKRAAGTLSSICMLDDTRIVVFEAGAVPSLVELLNSDDAGVLAGLLPAYCSKTTKLRSLP